MGCKLYVCMHSHKYMEKSIGINMVKFKTQMTLFIYILKKQKDIFIIYPNLVSSLII